MTRQDLEDAARDGFAGTLYSVESIQYVSSNLGHIYYSCPGCGKNRLPVFKPDELTLVEVVRNGLTEHERKHAGS